MLKVRRNDLGFTIAIKVCYLHGVGVVIWPEYLIWRKRRGIEGARCGGIPVYKHFSCNGITGSGSVSGCRPDDNIGLPIVIQVTNSKVLIAPKIHRGGKR